MRSITISLALAGILASQLMAGDVPEETISALYQKAKAQPQDRAERIKLNDAILAEARKCLADHPDVPASATGRDLLVRRVMLPAAMRLHRDEPASPERRDQLRGLAGEVAGSPITEGHRLVEEKVSAAELLAKLEIWPEPNAEPREAAKHIRKLLERFPAKADDKTSDAFHGQALVAAARLAMATKEHSLADELCKDIGASYLKTAGALDVLAAAGHPATFEGELATLDGKTLRFPEDAKGKVVVLDFWATWCAPCVASLPHIHEVHEKFKDRGVWVIGVSCDTPMPKETPDSNRAKVVDFIKAKDLPWTQTYSGIWPKVAEKYGIGSIPTVFVIGKDGRILSATARGREAELIEKALSAP
jgi:thiol-disulfide isomerase/thioredoxin